MVAGCAWRIVWVVCLYWCCYCICGGLVILCLSAMCLVVSSPACLVALAVGWC